jgi:alpha-mannosidase
MIEELNPLMQQTVLPRALAFRDRLKNAIWTRVGDVGVAFAGGTREHHSFAAARALRYKPVVLPFCWGRLFDQGWFRLRLPAVTSKRPLYLRWVDQGEGTLYHKGVPYAGFDVAHREAPLPAGGREFFLEGLCLQSGIWHPEATGMDPKGSRLQTAAVMVRDETVWEFFHDFDALLELALEEAKRWSEGGRAPTHSAGHTPHLHRAPVIYRRMLRILDDAMDGFDRSGLDAGARVLRAGYDFLGGQAWPLRAVLTGHAHIDLVWLWPERAGDYKAVHTFSTINRLMDRYPELRFGYSQPASYEAVGRRSPGLMKQISKRIKSGTWEPVGATYVESDTLLACGEALTRSFLLGQEGFRKLTGRPSKILWIPDVFGYAGCLPQMMKECGVNFFFTTKLTWSKINRFPHSSFRWRGIDGSEVLVHVTQEDSYNGAADPGELRRGAEAYVQADVHDEFLCPTGYGDGGGGVTPEMCERARRYRDLAGVPKTAWGRVDSFFDRLEQKRPMLPVFDGELYLEYHRGVYTSHGGLKEAFRKAERALQTWEAVRCATGGGDVDGQSWKRLVFAQFHDYIPGSSICEVYQEALPELCAIRHRALEAARLEAGAEQTGGKPAVKNWFNPLPLKRVAVVGSGTHRHLLTLPPLGSATEDCAVAAERAPTATVRKLTSGRVGAGFDAKGRVRHLTIDGRRLAITSPLCQLALYADHPHAFDSWEIDRQSMGMARMVDGPVGAVVGPADGVSASVAFSGALGAASRYTVRYRVDATHPVLLVIWEIDWHEKDVLLKALMPTSYAGRLVRYGAPFGSVLRSQNAGTLQEEALWEVPGSRWAVVSDDGESGGLAVTTEAKYGFSCRHGLLGVTLLRGAKVTGTAPHLAHVVPPTLRRDTHLPTRTDQGRHVIRMSLSLHHAGTVREELAPALAESLYGELVPCGPRQIAAVFPGLRGGESLVPCWAKPSGRGQWILRLHETMGRRGESEILLRPGWEALEVRLDGRAEDSLTPVHKVHFGPYQIKSLLIRKTKAATGSSQKPRQPV